MEPRSLDHDGTALHGLWRDGDGTPLVLVPGVMADATTFAPVAEALTTTAPVLVLDRRGRGGSGPLGDDYSVQTEVDDLLAWARELGGARLTGWSYGATLALEAAGQVLDGTADAPVTGSVVAYDPLLAPIGQDVLPSLREADPDRAVEIINVDFSHVPREQVEEMRASAQWPVLRELAKPLAAELSAANAFTADPGRWARVEAGLIVGEHSLDAEPYGPAFARAQALLPNGRTVVLPGHGHFTHLEDPARLARAMDELLAQ